MSKDTFINFNYHTLKKPRARDRLIDFLRKKRRKFIKSILKGRFWIYIIASIIIFYFVNKKEMETDKAFLYLSMLYCYLKLA